MPEFTYRLALRTFRGAPVKKKHPVIGEKTIEYKYPMQLPFGEEQAERPTVYLCNTSAKKNFKGDQVGH